MKTFICIIFICAIIAGCGTPKLTNTGESTSSTRYNSGKSPQINKPGIRDTVTVAGSEYLKFSGRNENGIFPELEGSWILHSMPAGDITGNSNNLIKETEANANKNSQTESGTVISQNKADNKEIKIKTDQSIKTTSSSTTTTIYSVNTKDSTKQITPNQGLTLHEPEKPSINLFGSNETFSGFTGCNRISGRYTLSTDNSITFRHSAPSTRMVCIGEYDESVYLSTLNRVNKYHSTGNQLQLFDGNKLLLIFTRK